MQSHARKCWEEDNWCELACTSKMKESHLFCGERERQAAVVTDTFVAGTAWADRARGVGELVRPLLEVGCVRDPTGKGGVGWSTPSNEAARDHWGLNPGVRRNPEARTPEGCAARPSRAWCRKIRGGRWRRRLRTGQWSGWPETWQRCRPSSECGQNGARDPLGLSLGMRRSLEARAPRRDPAGCVARLPRAGCERRQRGRQRLRTGQRCSWPEMQQR
ncbi:hypothetical protein NDU88_004694 [Pleurodeles waltl]|uniref:Uncharacterized protein n=1 Tax=Pleurodeles waltl TaxID=8319 RepID=A0AAV7PDK0_PLEWA|nr:hypothetical protein NDU88_004694 [Pleurodeles waltl]